MWSGPGAEDLFTFQGLQGFLIAFDETGRAILCGMSISRQVGTGTLVTHRHRVETLFP